jgi:hypothetical protein
VTRAGTLTKAQLALDWVRHSSKATDRAWQVLVILALYTNDQSGLSYPSVDTIANETRIPRRSVFNAIKALIGLGELEVAAHHRYAPTEYRVRFTNAPGDTPDAVDNPVTNAPGDTPDGFTSAAGGFTSAAGGFTSAAGGFTSANQGAISPGSGFPPLKDLYRTSKGKSARATSTPSSSSNHKDAVTLLRSWCESKTPRPRIPNWSQAVKVIAGFLDDGHSVDDITAAFADCPVVSINAINIGLDKLAKKRSNTTVTSNGSKASVYDAQQAAQQKLATETERDRIMKALATVSDPLDIEGLEADLAALDRRQLKAVAS